jgi:hypothetical protein
VKPAWRVIRIAAVLAVGGVVISTLLAEFIAWSGRVQFDPAAQQRFVAVGGLYVRAYDMRGAGWCYLTWDVLDRNMASMAQYCYDMHVEDFEGMPIPEYLHCDAPDSLPAWSRLWRPECWPKDIDMGDSIQHHSAMELGVGWPLRAFSIDWDIADPSHPHGGIMLPTAPWTTLRCLMWRPLAGGLALDSLIYAAALAGLVAAARLAVRARRRGRGLCTVCRYDLRGLASGSVCPECGAAGRVVNAPA